MNTKRNNIIYLTSTILLTIMIGMGVANYIFNTEVVGEMLTALGYPTYLIYPLAIAKTLGLIAIWFVKNKTLKEWAYAGLFFNLLLATISHIAVQDGQFVAPIIGLLLVLTSYFFERKTAKTVS